MLDYPEIMICQCFGFGAGGTARMGFDFEFRASPEIVIMLRDKQ